MLTLQHLASWTLGLLIVLIFVRATLDPLPDPPMGIVKVFDAPGEHIVFVSIAAKTGIPQDTPMRAFCEGILLSPCWS